MAVAYACVERRRMPAIMLQWLIKLARRGEKPVFISNRQEFLSIWGIAHAWEGLDPATGDGKVVPDSIQAHMDTLMLAFRRDELSLRMSDGYRVLGHSLWAVLFGLDKDYLRVSDQLFRKKPVDRNFLDGLYVKRSELLHWCEKEFKAPPGVWAQDAAKEGEQKRPPLENRARDEVFDRLACQAIARTYWDIDPNIHPAHMASAKAIQRYGNGRYYKDENTVKGWIAEVDPRKGKRKTGRPERIPYLIDLETGGLAE